MRIITAIFVLIVFTLLKILITKNNVSIFKKAPNLNWSGAFLIDPMNKANQYKH